MVELYTEDADLADFLKGFPEPLDALFIVSGVSIGTNAPDDAVLAQDTPGLAIRVVPSPHGKCLRCWNYRESVGANEEHPDLCERCAQVISQL
jgi:isoleucyl-tRNA synthetase